MIYDTVNRLSCYLGLSPELDELIRFILEHKEPQLITDGTTVIRKEIIWVNHNKVGLKETQPFFERHQTFLDLHMALSDGESIGYMPVDELEWQASTEETMLTSGPEGTVLDMKAGMFAIFFPWDAHRPSCGVGSVDKLIGKVLWTK